MYSRKFALYGGMAMVLMGVLSLLPGFVGTQYGIPELKLETSYGLFLGYFPMNIMNKIALIVFGLVGIWCSRNLIDKMSIRYARVVFLAFGVLAILGIIPQTNTLGGYWPLFHGEVIGHGVFAIIAEICASADTRSFTAELPKSL